MARIVILDSGPIGLLITRNGVSLGDACRAWVSDLGTAGAWIVVSSIVDYEVRRECLRLRSTPRLHNLDKLKRRFGLPGIDDEVMELAARFWADLRRAGKPTADPHALDADCILAAQASLVGQPGDIVTIATTNAGHLNRFPGIDARDWASIAP